MVRGRHADQSPAWKRYKNRKKQIRQDFQAGRISAEERSARLAEARSKHLCGGFPPSAERRRQIAQANRAASWLSENGAAALPDPGSYTENDCDETCIGARAYACSCPCEGANHGAAWGTPRGTPAQLWLAKLEEETARGRRQRARQAARRARQAGAAPAEVQQSQTDGMGTRRAIMAAYKPPAQIVSSAPRPLPESLPDPCPAYDLKEALCYVASASINYLRYEPADESPQKQMALMALISQIRAAFGLGAAVAAISENADLPTAVINTFLRQDMLGTSPDPSWQAAQRRHSKSAGRPAMSPSPGLMRRLAELDQRGYKVSEITRILNLERFPTLSGRGRWHPGTVVTAIARTRETLAAAEALRSVNGSALPGGRPAAAGPHLSGR